MIIKGNQAAQSNGANGNGNHSSVDCSATADANPDGFGACDAAAAHAPLAANCIGAVNATDSAASQVCNASEVRALHESHLDRRATGTEEIIGRLLDRLRGRLRWRFFRVDAEMISDAVNDAFMPFWENPQMFDASFGAPLEHYLFNAAARNLLNCLEGERRRRCREDLFAKTFFENFVRFSSSARNTSIADPTELLMEREKWDERFKCLKNARDREFVELWRDGELRVEPFAKVLGVAHLELELQSIAVTRAKNRLRKTLQRARVKFGWVA